VTPTYVARLSPDLLNLDRRQQTRKFQPFTFWVPIRDQKWDRRDTPKPHDVTVAMVPGGSWMSQAGGFAIDQIRVPMVGFMEDWVQSIPSGVIDSEAMTADADRLRAFLHERAQQHKWTASDLGKLEARIKSYVRSGYNKDNIGERLSELRETDDTLLFDQLLREGGMEVSQREDVLKRTWIAIFSLASAQAALESMENGGELRETEAKQLLKDYIDVVFQAEQLEVLLAIGRGIRARSIKDLEAAGGEGLPTTVFKTTVGDDQFLLYSVGENGVDDRARFVGTYGTDILMWPPILSLQREARSAK
jgi:hypothetical protein